MYLKTLGKLELTGSRLSRPKPLLLLTYLGLEGPKDRRFLSELFYQGTANPMAGLRVAFKHIREGASGALRGESQAVVTLAADALDLLRAVEAQDDAAVTHLYTGAFLREFFLKDVAVELEEWILGTREHLAGCFRRSLLRLAEAKATRGEREVAASYAEQAYLLAEADLAEPKQLELIYSLLTSAQNPRAAQVRRDLEDFGWPLQLSSAEARALFQAPVLSAEPDDALPGRDDKPSVLVERKTAGEHNLPANTTAFVGRSAELKELGRHLQTHRLITLLGMGGIGKTRLAIELARSQHHNFPDGVYLLRLASLQKATEIAASLADIFALEPQKNADVKTQVIRYLKDKAMLLVMDNFEHLLAGCGVVQDILEAAPHTKVLVTSRQKLKLSGEAVFNVSGLGFPAVTSQVQDNVLGTYALGYKDNEDNGDAQVTNDLSYSAVQLFLGTAERVRLGFRLAEGDTAAVRKICQLVEGHPLAIVLAASWLESLTPREVLAELMGGVALLETSLHDVPDRQRSIQAVFKGSWLNLTPEECAILASLAVFKGGFDRRAAEEVTGASLRQLSGLVTKSFLQHLPATGRYDMHELMRQFVVRQAADLGAARLRHSRFYLRLLEGCQNDLIGLEPRETVLKLQRDLDNIRAAWEWALRHDHSELLARGRTGLTRFYDLLGFYEEGLGRFQQVIAAFKAKRFRGSPPCLGGDPHLFLLDAASFATRQNKLRLAVALSREAVALAAALHDLKGELDGYAALGEAYHFAGRYRDSRKVLLPALRRARTEGFRETEGRCLIALGLTNRADYQKRFMYNKRALRLQQEFGNRTQEQVILHRLSIDSLEQHDYNAFDHYNAQVEKLSASVGRPHARAASHFLRGVYHTYMGRWHDALRFYERALLIFRQVGDSRYESYVLHNFCDTYNKMGEPKLAWDKGQAALAVALESNTVDAVSWAHTYLGYTCLAQAHTDAALFGEATQHFRDAHAGWQKLERRALVMQNLAGLALVALAQNDAAAATKRIGPVLDYLENGESLAGADDPLGIYYVGYRVLESTGDKRAYDALERAYRELQAHVARISDPKLRFSFLTKVPVNSTIIKSWRRLHDSRPRR